MAASDYTARQHHAAIRISTTFVDFNLEEEQDDFGWVHGQPGLVLRGPLDARTMEPQNTRNTLRAAAVPYWVRTKRLISSRGLPKLSSKQRRKPEAFEHRLRGPNDSSGQQVNVALGAIYPRVQRVLWFHFPFLTAGTTF